MDIFGWTKFLLTEHNLIAFKSKKITPLFFFPTKAMSCPKIPILVAEFTIFIKKEDPLKARTNDGDMLKIEPSSYHTIRSQSNHDSSLWLFVDFHPWFIHDSWMLSWIPFWKIYDVGRFSKNESWQSIKKWHACHVPTWKSRIQE